MRYIYVWPHRLTARTEPSQGLNRGSIPRGATTITQSENLPIFSRAVAKVVQAFFGQPSPFLYSPSINLSDIFVIILV